ncbi:MAG: hypothetical protein ACE3JK_06100 [Sporolactobacillus sp.]
MGIKTLIKIMAFLYLTAAALQPENPLLVQAAPAFPTEIFNTNRAPDFRTLSASSDLILVVHLDGQFTSWNTGHQVSGGHRLVNSRQILHVHRSLKGQPPSPLYLLTTVVRPLPRPSDPLNQKYTGPLADGDYLLFLKRYHTSQDSLLNGGFSAVYPLYNGHTIALDSGFAELGGLSIDQVANKL